MMRRLCRPVRLAVCCLACGLFASLFTGWAIAVVANGGAPWAIPADDNDALELSVSWWEANNPFPVQPVDAREIDRYMRTHIGSIGDLSDDQVQWTIGGATLHVWSRLVSLESFDTVTVETFEVGWPMRCLVGHCWYWDRNGVNSSVRSKESFATSGVFPVEGSWFGDHQRVIPYHVRPLGLVTNAIAYALVILVVSQITHRLRHYSRLRRRACIGCGHSLADRQTCCPECGRTEPRAGDYRRRTFVSRQ